MHACIHLDCAQQCRADLRGGASLQILTGIAELLDNPNITDPAQEKAYQIFSRDRAKYNK
jgi:hypothetical protein